MAAVVWLLPPVATLGCDDSPETALPATAATVARSVPVDTTEPGELAEGDARAFGFPIPRKMRVKASFPDATYAVGYVSFEAMTNYVRQRVLAERVDKGPVRTVFVNAQIKSEPRRMVNLEVRSDRGEVELVVRDRTRRPVEPGLTEQERWRRAGISAGGMKVIRGE